MLQGLAPMAKNKIPAKEPKPGKLLDPNTYELITRYFQVVRSVWNSAHNLPPQEALSKKKEAVGWACAAARHAGECSVDDGDSLADCLRRAAEELLAKAEELEGG